MGRFMIMVGLPASGKSSTAIKKAKEFNARIFSSDDYREKLLGNADDQSNNEVVFKALYNDMEAACKNHEDIIYDATNVTLKARKIALEMAKKYSYENIDAIVMATPIDLCVKRDLGRDRKVGKEVIYKFLYKFQMPHYFEGFNNIEVVFSEEQTKQTLLLRQKELTQLKTKMFEFNQRNPHHEFTVGEHCARVASFFPESDVRYWSATYHDIGKLYTQKFDEQGIAHYYSHDSVGAYMLLCYSAVIQNYVDSVIEFLFYVNYHMRAHRDFMGEKAKRKYSKLFGQDRFDGLMYFAQCDRKGAKNDC